MLFDKDFTQILHVGFGSANGQCLRFDRFKILSLAQVCAKGYNLAAVRFFKPLQDNRGIEAA